MLGQVVQLSGEESAAGSKHLAPAPRTGETLAPGVCGIVLPKPGRAGARPSQDALSAVAELVHRQEQLLIVLAEAIDCREQYTPGGSKRVMEHMGRFAEVLGLNDDERCTAERGGLLRDIGKLRIPNEVLLKHSVLTYEEWTLLQNHTTLGAEMVRAMGGLADIEPLVRSHHECFDGVGYPDGLEGEQIPLLARMLKIVDVYCAMTSPRLYRKNVYTHEQALSQLRAESGTHFDPELLRLFENAEIGQPPEAQSPLA